MSEWPVKVTRIPVEWAPKKYPHRYILDMGNGRRDEIRMEGGDLVLLASEGSMSPEVMSKALDWNEEVVTRIRFECEDLK
jgi:hypothetical protein